MCRAKSNGGRRCPMFSAKERSDVIEEQLAVAYSESMSYRLAGKPLPPGVRMKIDTLNAESYRLEEQIRAHEEEVARKEAEKEESRERRKAARAAKAAKQREEREARIAAGEDIAPNAPKEVSIYLAKSDHEALRRASFGDFTKEEEANGTLDETMNTISRRAGLETSWDEWREENPDGSPQDYLSENNLTMGDAARYTGKSVLEPLRSRLRAPLVFSDSARVRSILSGEEEIPMFEKGGDVGRRQTSMGTENSGQVRDKRIDLSLSGDDLDRVEGYRNMFGLTLSDAARCSLLGEDPRERRAHESIASYQRRLNVMKHTEENVAALGDPADGYERVLQAEAAKVREARGGAPRVASTPAPEAAPAPAPEPDYSYRMRHRAPVADEDYAPLHDLSELYGDDYLENPHHYTGRKDDREMFQQLRDAHGNPDAKVTIYRAVPGDVTDIHRGDWVALSADYARLHAASNGDSSWHVVKQEVPASTIWSEGNDLAEWGYDGDRLDGDVI